MTNKFDALIIGCGIAGASLAFFLAERGLKVAVTERLKPASGGTGLSAAIVRQHYSTPLMARLALRAVEIFEDAPSRLGRDAGYRAAGYLFLTPADALAATERNVVMQKSLGIETRMLSASEIAELAWLNPDGVAGAAFEPRGGYADPEVATQAFMDAAVEKGATLMERTPARALLRSGSRITGVDTDAGSLLAEWVINAAGPWSAPLAASAGIEMQMRVVREQDTIWEARANRPLPTMAISNAVDAIYIRPLAERRFIIGRGFPKTYVDVDPYNYRQTADDGFISDVGTRMSHRIPSLEGARLINSYAALYDVTVDWYQYVGPRAGLDGYADFCGGSGHGFKVAPAIAEELAGWLVDGAVRDDFRRLSYDRVGANELFVQAYGGNRG
jgi:sarcosine oxidase subunit beta